MSTKPIAPNRRGHQSPAECSSLPFEKGEILIPPYLHAALCEGAASSRIHCRNSFGQVSKLAATVDVILISDNDIELHIMTTASTTVDWPGHQQDIKVGRYYCDAESYFLNHPRIGLAIANQSQFALLDTWNAKRKADGSHGFDILCQTSGREPDRKPSGRPFRLASLGGTFNTLHAGHREYLKSALRLADEVHILIANDDYAIARKSYAPRSLKARRAALRNYVRSLGCSERVITQTLSSVDDIESYVRETEKLDVVVTERAYFDWFEGWNELRTRSGFWSYDVLCRERTLVQGSDISSSMFEAIQSDRSIDQDRLFDLDIPLSPY